MTWTICGSLLNCVFVPAARVNTLSDSLTTDSCKTLAIVFKMSIKQSYEMSTFPLRDVMILSHSENHDGECSTFWRVYQFRLVRGAMMDLWWLLLGHAPGSQFWPTYHVTCKCEKCLHSSSVKYIFSKYYLMQLLCNVFSLGVSSFSNFEVKGEAPTVGKTVTRHARFAGFY